MAADILTELDRLTDRLYQEFNTINTVRGSLPNLSTIDKSSLVNAINELKNTVDSINSVNIINDFTNTSTTEVWSAAKSKSYVDSLLVDWKIDKVTDLNDQAEKARDYLMKLPSRLTRIADRIPAPEQHYQFKWINS